MLEGIAQPNLPYYPTSCFKMLRQDQRLNREEHEGAKKHEENQIGEKDIGGDYVSLCKVGAKRTP
jgi:hypothetical protein